MTTKRKILFVAGTGRCGSTLIESALSQVNDIMALGELRYIWERGLKQDRLTGAGDRFSENVFWQNIVDNIPGKEPLNPLRMRDLFFKKTMSKKDISEYSRSLNELYDILFKQADRDILVDSSKIPNYLHALIEADVADIYILHVTRDARAVVSSWQNPKYDKGKGAMMSRKGFFSALLESIFINRWIARDFSQNTNFHTLAYEDFCSHPREKLDFILSWLDLSTNKNPIQPSGDFAIKVNHPTISGNPIRFEGGNITIALDKKWQNNLPLWQKILTSIAIFFDKKTR